MGSNVVKCILPDCHNHEEFWRLLAHANPHIQSSALRIVGYLVVHSDKARGILVTGSAKLWRILRNASTQTNPRIVSVSLTTPQATWMGCWPRVGSA